MKYNEQTKEIAKNMIKEGKRVTDISKEMKINIKTIISWTSKERNDYDNFLKNEALKLRSQNLSILEISKKLDIDRSKLAKWLSDKPEHIACLNHKIKMKKSVQDLLKKGKSLKEINSILNLNIKTTTFYKWCRGIEKPLHPLYNTKEIKNDYFSDENLLKHPERFVIVGFIAADGCISDTKTGQKILCIALCEKDKNVLETINEEICNKTRKLTYNKKTKSFILSIPSDQISKDLKKYNIVPRKTYIYDLPSLNEEQMSYFVRGYFYGDGCLYRGKSYGSSGYYFISTYNFAKSLQEFLLKNKILDREFKIYKHQNVFQFCLKGRQGSKFAKYIFQDEKMMLMQRKHFIFEEIIKASKWTDEEKQLVLNVDIDEFCKITGRSKKSALSTKQKLKKKQKVNLL